MNKDKGKHYLALTILFIFIVFMIVSISVLLGGTLLFSLVQNNMIIESTDFDTNVKKIIFYMAIFSIAVGTLMVIFLGELLLKPIKHLIIKLKQLARGDFGTRLQFLHPLDKHPTFTELSESFNTMAEELENTEILRSDFINNFSHEFKTPIVSIAGFAKLLKRGDLTEDQKEEYLNIIEEESLRLSYMATNVLNLTKVESQTILTDVSEFNLSEQIRSSILLLENHWTKKKLEFSVEFDEYYIHANEELLKQVWINLIHNAIKFSPEYGLVVIKIEEQESQYKITVANSGDEIPLESRDKIFNKFYQADESHSSEGNGVGLAIVKRILELHKGEITVDCKNGITTFTVKISK